MVLAGVIGMLAAGALGLTGPADVLVGTAVAVVAATAETLMLVRAVRQGRREYRPRFPRSET